MAPSRSDRLRGTLELLVLRTLAWGPRHGYAIARWLGETTRDKLRIEEGSLYPALYRMQKRGLLASDWQTSELGRPAKFYRLTPAGRKQLEDEPDNFSNARIDLMMWCSSPPPFAPALRERPLAF